MPLFRFCALVVFTVGFAAVVNAQGDKPFPTNDEINLLLTQTERAIQQYKPLIDQEEIQLGKGKDFAEAVANDRQVVNALETAIKAFKAKPQGFNGPLGFSFFEWLDDSSRNALACSNSASIGATQYLLAGNTDKAEVLIHLGQSCTDVSTLIYTVSENAGSLYQRFVEEELQLATQATDLAEKCTDILKKSGIKPTK